MNLLKSGNHKITFYYGNQTLNGVKYNHTGIDMIMGPSNLDYIIAAARGKVIKVVDNVRGYRKNSYGNHVILEHSNGIKTLYAHLKLGSINVREGKIIDKATNLGYMGATGSVTGAHLHFEVRINDKTVNPLPYFQDKIHIIGYGENTDKQISYTPGNYVCNYNMNLRDGAGINYAIKSVDKLTDDGKANATLKSGHAVYKKGTIFTAKEIIFNTAGSIWARSPSGYVCLKDIRTIYCSKA